MSLMLHLPPVHISSFHLSFSIIDLAIIAIFVLQIFWGAKLGFASATFALTGEVIGFILGLLYADSIAKLLDHQFHINILINRSISDRINVPVNLAEGVSQTIADGIVFLALFLIIQAIFLFIGRIVHHRVGVRRMKVLSNSFFGMFVGFLKAGLEVMLFLIIWTTVAANPPVSDAIHAAGADHLTEGSILLPTIMRLVPPSSPVSKFI
jgi:uncharacterized membrane protein required for colicin V production